MNYDVTDSVTAIGWDRFAIAAGMYSNCIFYVHTHGNTTSFWSDWNDYWYEYNGVNPAHEIENIYGSGGGGANHLDLLPYRESANGTELPPYNSSGSPPINLAFLDTCSAGTTNAFSTILYPYGNYFAPIQPPSYTENQSLIGYSISFHLPYTSTCGDAFWSALEAGYTVAEARIEAFDAYNGSNKPLQPVDFMHVWGDFYTRLKGVYTGDQSAPHPTVWYRNL